MTKMQSKVFSCDEKTRIVLELLKDESPISVLSSKYGVSCKTIQNWKKQFLGNASLAFEPAKAIIEYKEEIIKLREENDALAKALGKSTVERDWALGKLKSLDLSNRLSLVDSKLDRLPKTRQCELLSINRATITRVAN